MEDSRLAALLESNRFYDDEMHRIAAEMHETAIVSRELIEMTRTSLREADRLLKRK